MKDNDWLGRVNDLKEDICTRKLEYIGFSKKQISELKERLDSIAMKIVDEYIKEQTK